MDLVLMTEFYPLSRGEEFLETEIPYLARRFNKIILVPRKGELAVKRPVPDNVFVDSDLLIKLTSKSNRLRLLLANPILVVKLLIDDVTGVNKRGKLGFILLMQRFNAIAEALMARTVIMKYRKRDTQYYSYWGNSSALGLAIMRSKKEVEKNIVRLHGYDLYDERYISGGVPYRDYIIKNSSVVACISETGKKYLIKKRLYSNLIVSRLGVNDNGVNPEMEDKDCVLRIVSCSSVIPIKRVHLIIDILKKTTVPIEWIHIGDGPGMGDLKKAASSLQASISVEFLGHLPNYKVLELYRKKHIDVMIHLSETEGIPVSFMEAISFGVPIISTAVGGVAEIVTHQTGILIDPDVDVKAAANILSAFKESHYTSEVFRRNVREFWKYNFSASINYHSFIQDVLLQ